MIGRDDDEPEVIGGDGDDSECEGSDNVSVMDFVNLHLHETQVTWPNNNWRIWSQIFSPLSCCKSTFETPQVAGRLAV